jgi:hypothetical protein
MNESLVIDQPILDLELSEKVSVSFEPIDLTIVSGYGKCKTCTKCEGFEASFWGGGLKCICGHHQSVHR